MSATPLTSPLRRRIRGWVVGTLSRSQATPVDYDQPRGDPGLFGPDTVTWKIHADFPGMMAGGICALMLQSLHPRALAGVWDHSDFRRDTLGRLRRTTAFVAGTTYGPRAEAERLIARVKAIHQRVRGIAPDGRPYSADDPELLVWVHCAETWSFLHGYERYRDLRLPRAVQDRYFDETARIAQALGARAVPRSAAAVEAYFQSVQGQLEYGPRAREVLAVLERVRLPLPAGFLTREVFLGAGAALLPEWALRLMRRPRLRRLRDRAAARSLRTAAPVIRAALSEGVAARACRRVGVGLESLSF
jgi:uncharacterized protein (DUF2236 family)